MGVIKSDGSDYLTPLGMNGSRTLPLWGFSLDVQFVEHSSVQWE